MDSLIGNRDFAFCAGPERRWAFKVRIEVRATAIRGCAREGGICTGSGCGGFNLSFLGLALVFWRWSCTNVVILRQLPHWAYA
jgi:hypothetical protein